MDFENLGWIFRCVRKLNDSFSGSRKVNYMSLSPNLQFYEIKQHVDTVKNEKVLFFVFIHFRQSLPMSGKLWFWGSWKNGKHSSLWLQVNMAGPCPTKDRMNSLLRKAEDGFPELAQKRPAAPQKWPCRFRDEALLLKGPMPTLTGTLPWPADNTRNLILPLHQEPPCRSSAKPLYTFPHRLRQERPPQRNLWMCH